MQLAELIPTLTLLDDEEVVRGGNTESQPALPVTEKPKESDGRRSFVFGMRQDIASAASTKYGDFVHNV